MLYAVALGSLLAMLLQSLGSRDLWIQAASVSFWIVVALPFARYWSDSAASFSEFQAGDSWLLSESPLIPEKFPLCQMNKRVEGEV